MVLIAVALSNVLSPPEVPATVPLGAVLAFLPAAPTTTVKVSPTLTGMVF